MVLSSVVISYLLTHFQEQSIEIFERHSNTKSGLEKKHERVLNAIGKFSSEWTTPSANLASAMLDFDFSKHIVTKKGYEQGMMIIPITDRDSHSYELGKPVCMHFDRIALKMNGTLGNNLPPYREDFVRLATKDEIGIFFSNLAKPASLKESGTRSFIERMIKEAKFQIEK